MKKILLRLLRVLLTIVLVVIDLLLLCYLTRRITIEPWARDQLARVLADALDAEVEIGAIGGDWLTSLSVEGLQVRGHENSVVRRVADGRATLSFSVPRLLGEGLSGLECGTFTATAAEIRLPPPASEAPPPPGRSGAPFELPALRPVLGALAHGFEVTVDDLRLGHDEAMRQGPFHLRLRPGSGNRTVAWRFTGLSGTAHLVADDDLTAAHVASASTAGTTTSATTAEGYTAHVDLELQDLGQGLRIAGLPATLDVEGGTLHARITAVRSPLVVRGVVTIEDAVQGGRVLDRSLVRVQLDRRTLVVGEAEVDVDGLWVRVHDVQAPSPFAAGEPTDWLRALHGLVAVQVHDLSPWAALLPAELQPFLPIVGRVQGRVTDRVLRLAPSTLQGRGVQLDITGGRLPLTADALQGAGSGVVEFALRSAPGAAFDVPGLGPVGVGGTVGGSVHGSLEQPVVQVDVNLTRVLTARGVMGAVAAKASYAAGEFALRELRVQALDPVGGSGIAAVVQGSATFRPAANGEHARATADLAGTLPPQWLALAGLPRALHGQLQPVEFALRGELVLPNGVADVAGGAAGAGGVMGTPPAQPDGAAPSAPLPEGAAHVEVRGIRFASLPAMRVVADASLQDGVLHVPLVRADGLGLLHAEGTLPLREGGGPLLFEAHADDLQIGALSELLGFGPLVGELNLQATASGTLRRPDVAARLSLRVPDPFTQRPQLWPSASFGPLPHADLGLDMQVTSRGDTLHLDGLRLELAAPEPGLATHHELLVPPFHDEAALLSIAALGPLPIQLVPGQGLSPAATTTPLTGHLRLANRGPFGSPHPITANARFLIDAAMVAVRDLTVQAGPGRLHGEVMVDHLVPALLQPGTVGEQATALRGELRLDEFSLQALPEDLTGIASLEGLASGNLELGGSLAAPAPELELTVRQAAMKLRTLPRISGIDARLQVHPDRAAIDAHAAMGAGPIHVHGTLEAGEQNLFASLPTARIDAAITGKNTLLYRDSGLRLRASPDLRVTGTLAALEVRGELLLANSEYGKYMSLLPDLRAEGGASPLQALALPTFPGGEKVTVDVAIRTAPGQPFEVSANVVETEAVIDMRIAGTAAVPRLTGSITANEGIVRMPGSKLTLQSVVLEFTESPTIDPRIFVTAEGRRYGYRILVNVEGTLTNPQVHMSSVPPLPPEELIVLVTTGKLPSQLQEGGLRGGATLIGSYLAEELYNTWFGGTGEDAESFADRLSIEMGQEISKRGQETIVVEFKLNDNWALQAERDVYEDYNMGVVFRMRF